MTGNQTQELTRYTRLRKRCDLLTWTPNTVMIMPSMTCHMTLVSA